MITDSGKREEFETGSVSDTQKGKGRCDLLPLDCLPFEKYGDNDVFKSINEFEETGKVKYIEAAIKWLCNQFFPNDETAVLELSVHYEEGAEKYSENNWKLGQPVSRYLSSGIRHYLKHQRGDSDERHDRAALWNLVAAIWTCKHKPELNDFAKMGKIVMPGEYVCGYHRYEIPEFLPMTNENLEKHKDGE